MPFTVGFRSHRTLRRCSAALYLTSAARTSLRRREYAFVAFQRGRVAVSAQLAGSPLSISHCTARRLAMDDQQHLDSLRNALSKSMPICDMTEAEWDTVF